MKEVQCGYLEPSMFEVEVDLDVSLIEEDYSSDSNFDEDDPMDSDFDSDPDTYNHLCGICNNRFRNARKTENHLVTAHPFLIFIGTIDDSESKLWDKFVFDDEPETDDRIMMLIHNNYKNYEMCEDPAMCRALFVQETVSDDVIDSLFGICQEKDLTQLFPKSNMPDEDDENNYQKAKNTSNESHEVQ